jgi:hypothetical protein
MRTAALTGARALLLLGATVLAFFSGGFFDVPRTIAGAVAWAVVALLAGLGLRVLPRSRAGRAAVAGLALYCAWVGLSLLWAPLAGEAYQDLQRVVLYLAVVLAGVALLRDRRAARAVEPALAGGALVVVGYGLSERLLPGLLHFERSVSAGGRLDQPLTYWNAMGLLAALGLVLSARLAGDRTRPPGLRAAAAAAAAPFGLAVYVSFSRGALLAVGVGLVVLVAACPTWVQLRAAAIALGAGLAAALAASPYGGVTSLTGTLGTREAEGAATLGTLAAICLLAAILSFWSARDERRREARTARLPLSRHAGLAATAAVVAGLSVFVAVAANEPQGATGGRPQAGAQRYTTLQSNRYAYWRVARKAFLAHPLKGVGSSGFRVEWLRRRPFVESVHDAHSLYLETAAELGLVGLAFLGTALGGVAVAARRGHRADAVLVAGPIAGLAMWAVHAGVDWDWEMPGVTIAVLVLAGLVLARADGSADPPSGYVPPGVVARLGAAARERGAGAAAASLVGWARRWLGGWLRPGDGSFELGGDRYEYLHHRHNFTWLNERAIEVPIGARAVAAAPAGARVLEVGNVLGHYGTARPRDVLDKYERGPGVVNSDVLDFRPADRYDLIVSLSTLEHVGWDEEPRDPERAVAAIAHLRELLAPGGTLLATVPVGYHPELDRAIREGRTGFDAVSALRRDPGGGWREVAPAEVWDTPYDRLLYEAGGVLVCTARADG